MIKYIILFDPEEKAIVKSSFLSLFKSVYEKELDEISWNHQIINSPYNDSPLFLAMDGDEVIGSAMMILQKSIIDNREYKYYLFTTSAILKEYRPKGIYAELLKIQKKYVKKMNADYILAFPNKIAYPVLKLFGGFKDLKKINLVKSTFDKLDLENITNSLIIDENIFNWRFEHKDYRFCEKKNKVLIYKKYINSYDLLAVYNKENFNFSFENSKFENNHKIIVIDSYIDRNLGGKIVKKINSNYFPINKEIDYSKLDVNLLMSDVF